MPQSITPPAHTYRSQGLSATVHRACRDCGAPGVWTSGDSIKQGWPGCHVEADDALLGQPVGPMCPNCTGDRAPGLWQSLGEIWRKHFTAP